MISRKISVQEKRKNITYHVASLRSRISIHEELSSIKEHGTGSNRVKVTSPSQKENTYSPAGVMFLARIDRCVTDVSRHASVTKK